MIKEVKVRVNDSRAFRSWEEKISTKTTLADIIGNDDTPIQIRITISETTLYGYGPKGCVAVVLE